MSVINTNLNALVAQESSRASGLKLSQAMERLSTGKRINSAKDDAAGLAISNRMTSQVRGISMAVRNANDAISMSQTAEGAYGQVGDILQRMRELAVQAASGTVTTSDRESLQLEVSQLVQEVNHIAATTNHNNIKLLDGSAKDIVIQTGANRVDTIKMDFDSVKANHIGAGVQPSLTSSGGNATAMAALANGDLVINGVDIGQSFAESDGFSTGSNAASAIAKVTAINLKSDQTGVIAKVADTNVSGAAMTATASASGTITINGYTTANITTTADLALSRKLVADAINAISGATGVKAVDTLNDKDGVRLIADDGRNIVVAQNTLTAGSTGVAASATFVGSYHLYSANGKDITIDTKQNGGTELLKKAGLQLGTYAYGSAQAVTVGRAVAAAGAAPDNATTGVLNGDTLVINNIAIGAAVTTDDTASFNLATSSTRAASAIAIAAAINKQTDKTGVRAVAQANVLRGTGFTPATSENIMINGQAMTVNTVDIQNVIDTINEYTGKTGVKAALFGNALELRAEDGRNISIGATTAADAFGLTGVAIGAAGTSAGSATFYSSVQLLSDTAFEVKAGTEGTANFELLGFREGSFGGAAGDKIAEVSLTTQAGANSALRAIDAAVDQVSAAQARSGALNNRLDAIVNNLSESLQNMSASRSRILDTDYATETTALAKSQIISQAATAMLAQANQGPQSVLALLK